MNNLCIMEIKMMNYNYDDYESCDYAYYEYQELLFHEFLQEMKCACMVPKIYNLPNNLTPTHRFWEVD